MATTIPKPIDQLVFNSKAEHTQIEARYWKWIVSVYAQEEERRFTKTGTDYDSNSRGATTGNTR